MLEWSIRKIKMAVNIENSQDNLAIAEKVVKKIVNKGMDRAEKILDEHIDLLHRISGALLEREILDSEEIDKLINGEELPPYNKPAIVNDEKPQAINENGTEKKSEEINKPN